MHDWYDIGIDGGGTKTQAVLTDKHGRVLAQAFTTATNPNDVGVEKSVELVVSLVISLLTQTGVDPAHVSLFAGISGALNHKENLLSKLGDALPAIGKIDVGSDIVNLMYAELPPGDGACVICGTGSACFLTCQDDLYRIGGWGYLLDSAGSGYDIGRMALEATLKAYDGRGQATMLTQLLTSYLGKPTQDALTDIYQKGKSYIASCAPFVFEAATLGDAVAEAILDANAKALADMMVTAYHKCESLAGHRNTPLPVAMGGSVNQKAAPMWTSRVAKFLPDSVAIAMSVANTPMVVGAVMKAYTNHQPDLSSNDHMAHIASVKQGYLAFAQS